MRTEKTPSTEAEMVIIGLFGYQTQERETVAESWIFQVAVNDAVGPSGSLPANRSSAAQHLCDHVDAPSEAKDWDGPIDAYILGSAEENGTPLPQYTSPDGEAHAELDVSHEGVSVSLYIGNTVVDETWMAWAELVDEGCWSAFSNVTIDPTTVSLDSGDA